MNRIEVRAEEVPLPAWVDALTRYIQNVLNTLGKDDWDLSLLFCNDAYIANLNAQYRNKDEATDVLSFSLGETYADEDGKERYLPGDIVISLETLEENARYFAVSLDEELRRLVIHGILHLSGMDHGTNEKSEPMLLLQEDLLKQTEERILPPLGNGGTL
jgi:probable rRNA maturation factor